MRLIDAEKLAEVLNRYLAAQRSEDGEVFFNEKDTLALEAWNRRHNDD